MLKQFCTLPSSKEAKDMCDSDYLYCYINMLIDKEELNVEEDVNINFNLQCK